MAIAIDFGTSNTVVARWNPLDDRPETVVLPQLSRRDPGNPPLVPSLIHVEDAASGQVLCGQLVRDRGLDRVAQRFFSQFKRGIGSPIQGYLPELDGCAVSFEQLGEWFLREVLGDVQQVPLPVDSLVLTVPVDSFEAYRGWLGQVCDRLGVERVQMIDEPTAAALGYGMADQDLLLVVDFGGGTLDLSLVKLETPRPETASRPLGFILKWGDKSFAGDSGQRPRLARVLAKVGLTLGGSDLDTWVAEHLATTLGLSADRVLTRLSERLKIALSSQPAATEVYFDAETFDSRELQLDREQFADLLRQRGLFGQLDGAMAALLQQARRQGITPEDIGAVLMVGGTCLIPAIQDWMVGYFPREKVRCDRPFEAIAQGALQLARGLELQDFLYHSYGVRYWNHREQRHDWHPLIQAGQAYPMSQPVELVLGASVTNQPSIELILGELSGESQQTEIFFDGDRLISRQTGGRQTVQPLNDREGARAIARLDPPGEPGLDRLRVQFRVDGDRRLRITVDDLLGDVTLLENAVVAELR